MKASSTLAEPRVGRASGCGQPGATAMHPGLRAAAVLLLAAFLAFGLTGCAAQGSAAQPSVLAAGTVEPTDAQRLATIRLELAAAFLENNQPAVALEEANRAVQADPNLAAAHNLRGLVLLQLNEPVLAEQSLQQALRLAPRDGDSWHNLAWLQCQQGRFAEAMQSFARALQAPNYPALPRSWMAQGICQARAGQSAEAVQSLTRSFELDSGNPITLYNLALLLHQRQDSERARFYLRRLNHSEFANAESLWLGVKIENRLQNREAAQQLGRQLQRRFPDSRQAHAYERGAFDE